MRLIFLAIFFLLAGLRLHAGVEVEFPDAEEPAKIVKLVDEPLVRDGELEPIRIDGLLVYHSGAHYYGGKIQKAEVFDELKKGMTLREIVTLLGPGSQNKFEGIGFLCWRCEDGRILRVWPTGRLDEKANYHTNLYGTSERREDVRKLVKELVSKFDIVDGKVAVTLAEDTHQAKAGETRVYGEGQVFQKVDPLPRIDFRILKIEGDSVHCGYFYQAPVEGLLRYSENGTLILKKIE